jgi:hypothetical protein
MTVEEGSEEFDAIYVRLGQSAIEQTDRSMNDRLGCAPWKGGAFQWV